jgi:activator of 2-hydroxyglutaryl-CoA dehydratase
MLLKHLKELARRHGERTKAYEASRLELAEAIRETAAEGTRQVDIVNATGYTREQIRRIVAGRTR